jgi:hypothetical protein
MVSSNATSYTPDIIMFYDRETESNDLFSNLDLAAACVTEIYIRQTLRSSQPMLEMNRLKFSFQIKWSRVINMHSYRRKHQLTIFALQYLRLLADC